MARLLRVHFSSIGHQDARLAPLTLDLRHASVGAEAGTGANTVIWLRNGGGKSSILNLFYSVFRPSAREFLGSSAEGKARRLEQYVKGRDLAFVVTEWDVEAPSDLELLAQAPARTRVVGQMLAWKNQRVSSDTSNLRRLFFSLLCRPGELDFDSLPILGLGEPAESFDAFRDWLRDVQHDAKGTEVVSTDHQQKWGKHLEQIGLDPELFRYQLAMNQREGAADEVFRFRREADFIKFLLELAFDPRTADQIAANLQAQRDNLRERPRWELDRRFVGEALEHVRPLAAAVGELGEARQRLDAAIQRTAATVAALDLHVEELGRGLEQAREQAAKAKDDARVADNERMKKARWARGLERLALQFDEQEARAQVEEAEALLEEAKIERKVAGAAKELRRLRTVDAELQELREALARAEEEIEPLRLAACRRGSILRAVLRGERDRIGALVTQLQRLCKEAEQAEEKARTSERQALKQAATLTAEIGKLDGRITRRDRARERLLDADRLERREAATEGLERWKGKESELQAARDQASEDRKERLERLEDLSKRKAELSGEREKAATRAKELEGQLETAYQWRDRLMTDPRLLEVEGVEEASLESPGLESRLRHRAEVARRRGFDSRVDGARDRRALDWMREHGLLPSPLDVQRVVDALAKRGVSAYSGPKYLEQNAPVEQRRGLILRDPARYCGVIVLDDEALDGARALDVDGLEAPVMISKVRELSATSAPDHTVVLGPDAALYDPSAAARRLAELEKAVARREEEQRDLAKEERSFSSAADDVARFVQEHGEGRLDNLAREHRDVEQRHRIAQDELKRLGEQETALRTEVRDLEARLDQLTKELQQVEQAVTAIRQFIEEHDEGIEEVRQRKDQASQELRLAETEAEESAKEAKTRKDSAKEFHGRSVEQQSVVTQLGQEHDAVAHYGEPPPAPVTESIEAARSAYETARKQYEGEIKAAGIQARIEEREKSRAELKSGYDRAARGLELNAIERLAARSDLDAEQQRLEDAEREQVQALATAKAQHHAAKTKLAEANKKRREADDLPADVERPPDAASARRRATDLEVEAEQHRVQAGLAEEQQKRHETQESQLEQRAGKAKGYSESMRSVAQGAQVELPRVRAAALEPHPDRLEGMVKALKDEFTESKRDTERLQQVVQQRAEAVRQIATRSDYLDLRATYQERMKESTEELSARAPSLTEELDRRLMVIEQALDKLDEDRQLIVEQLLHVADQITKLLQRAESSSRLPPTIEGWAGRPYLRVKFKPPQTDEEKRSLLAPMVDRLVEQAQIPGGIELVFRTAQELAGARGFDVQILKPDAEPRPDPIPIHQMSTFSRGQQLTAAILLYCTLVQLRARTRGRTHGTADAGVLILDNPIGTCSNVALLRLQRTIAAQMRVQLVYTTGVDDLEALETLPNKIRLRNTHRDRGTGYYHVTEDEPDRGVIEGVRLVEVPAR